MANKKKERSKSKVSNKSLSHRILLAEDDLEMRRMLTWYLRNFDYTVDECHDGKILMNKVFQIYVSTNNNQCDLIISDVKLPNISGIDVFEKFANVKRLPPIILMTVFRVRKYMKGQKNLELKKYLLSHLT